MNLFPLCTYNSSQPVTSYYASTFSDYGFYAGGTVGVVITSIFLYFGIAKPAFENPKPDVNYRCLAIEVAGVGLTAPPLIGWLAGKTLGTVADYVNNAAKRVYCADVAKIDRR